jgi:hypothetical protein
MLIAYQLHQVSKNTIFCTFWKVTKGFLSQLNKDDPSLWISLSCFVFIWAISFSLETKSNLPCVPKPYFVVVKMKFNIFGSVILYPDRFSY